MIRVPGSVLLCLILLASSFSVTTTCLLAPPAGITLVGKGEVSGTALDKSGLTGNICQAGAPANCVPKAIFGGFGSDLTSLVNLEPQNLSGPLYPPGQVKKALKSQ